MSTDVTINTDKPITRKFLVLRFSSIGDIVLTTPVVRCIKQQIHNSEIHYVTKVQFAGILKNNPYVDKVIELEDYVDEVIAQLKNEQYECIIDLHNNLRTMQLKRAFKKTKATVVNKLNVRKWLLTNLKLNTMPSVHIVDRYMDTVSHLGIRNDGQGLNFFIPDNDLVKDGDIPTAHMAGYIAIVIGGAHATKQLPLNQLQILVEKINHPIMLLGGKEDAALGAQLAQYDSFKIYNACGKFNLNESADLVRRSKFVITNDTGLMHIAAAFKKPIISIWGNTVPAFGMTPYYGTYTVMNAIIENKKLRCRPCSKIGYNACPKGHFKCMNDLNMDDVVATVNTFLKRN